MCFQHNVSCLETNHSNLPVQTAVIGPNAKVAVFCGGGSAALRPYYSVTPYEGISAKVGTENIKYRLGAYSHKDLPLLGPQLKTRSGEKGVTFRAFTEPPSVETRQAVEEIHLDDTSIFLADYYHPRLEDPLWWAEIEGIFTPELDGDYDFGLAVFGTGTLSLGGKLIVDNETKQQAGDSFFGSGTIEEIGTMTLNAGQDYMLKVLYASAPTSKLSRIGEISFRGGGIRIGGARKVNAHDELQAAVELAAEVDQVVVCAGLNVTYYLILSPHCESADCRTSLIGNLKVSIDLIWTSLVMWMSSLWRLPKLMQTRW